MIKNVLHKHCNFEKYQEGIIIRNKLTFDERKVENDLNESDKWFRQLLDSNETEAFKILLEEVKRDNNLDCLRLLV